MVFQGGLPVQIMVVVEATVVRKGRFCKGEALRFFQYKLLCRPESATITCLYIEVSPLWCDAWDIDYV